MKVLKNIYFISLCLGVLFVSGCGSDSQDYSGTETTSAYYYKSNGLCYDSSNSQIDSSYCDGLSYYLYNGYCYANDGTQQSGITNCTSNTYFIGGSYCYNQSSAATTYSYCTSSSTTTTGYYDSNGVCYDSSNTQVNYSTYCSALSYKISGLYCYEVSSGTQVSLSNCTSNTYYYVSGSCYNSSYQAVSTSYCSSGTATTTGACSGIYYYFDQYGDTWQVTCDGVAGYGNCSGYYLLNTSTNAFQNCQ